MKLVGRGETCDKIPGVLIYLLRHAEAEDVSPTGRDEDRRLTEVGRKRMKPIARGLARLVNALDEILVSPLERARETAEYVSTACDFDRPFRETVNLRPAADPAATLAELERLKAETVLLVGHQPHLGRLTGRLLTGRSDVEVPLKKAGAAAFSAERSTTFSLDRGELLFFASPKLLEKLG